MTDPSERSPARLFTSHGTVLYLDLNAGELRHGPIDSSPANVSLVAEASDRRASPLACRLVTTASGAEQFIHCAADRCQVAGEADGSQPAGAVLRLVPLERGLFALKGDGDYLSAVPGGSLRLSAPTCSTWECLLASEDWCGADAAGRVGVDARDPSIAGLNVKKIIIDPRLRARVEAATKRTKLLIFGYPHWSHGRVYYEVGKRLHAHGYLVDIINWQIDHAAYFSSLSTYYDLFLTSPDGVTVLADAYGIPYEKMIVVSHHENDIRMLIEQRGLEPFDSFAGYGAVSDYVYCASMMRGVARPPMVVSLGVDCEEFHMPPAERLETVGYASSMSVTTFGVEWKRGHLAEAAAEAAGLSFTIAGSTGAQTSFHEMPAFYRSVGAVLTSSISEAAQLPVMEAAAAGRLVIGTPVGHFPLRAYQGGGIIAPVQADKFVAFAAETLAYYKAHPDEYLDKCLAIQDAARKFDWRHSIPEWVELVDSAGKQQART